MEISEVKRRVVETISQARRRASERQVRNDQAAREYESFLETTAIPMFKQVVNVLRAQGLMFTVFTPGGSVRLASDRTGTDFIELLLDTTGDHPQVQGHSRRSRGGRVIDSERPIGPPGALSEDDVLTFVLKE